MKNTKEISSILSAIFCVNLAKRKNADKDIENICRYAFNRLFNGNPNLLVLQTAGLTKKQIIKLVNEMIYAETDYKKYIEWKNYQEEKRNEQ